MTPQPVSAAAARPSSTATSSAGHTGAGAPLPRPRLLPCPQRAWGAAATAQRGAGALQGGRGDIRTEPSCGGRLQPPTSASPARRRGGEQMRCDSLCSWRASPLLHVLGLGRKGDPDRGLRRCWQRSSGCSPDGRAPSKAGLIAFASWYQPRCTHCSPPRLPEPSFTARGPNASSAPSAYM